MIDRVIDDEESVVHALAGGRGGWICDLPSGASADALHSL